MYIVPLYKINFVCNKYKSGQDMYKINQGHSVELETKKDDSEAIWHTFYKLITKFHSILY